MELSNFCEIVLSLLHIPIQTVDESNTTSLYNSLTIPSKINEIIKSNRYQVVKGIQREGIVRLKDVSQFSYFGFATSDHRIVIGPFLDQEMTEQNLTALKKRLRLIGEDAMLLDTMIHQLRILSSAEIMFILNLFTQLAGNKLESISFETLTPQVVRSAKQIDVDGIFKEFEFVKKNYQAEDLFLQIIESGDVVQAKQFFTEDIMMNLPERAINDTLRNTKTRLTILNTICNRAAIRGGIDVQLGHQISTNFGIRIEQMTSNFDANKFMREILVSYAEAVHNYAIKDYSNLVRNAILFIRRNITTNVSLKDIADYLFVSKEHLSRQFKQETSQTISQHIYKVKVIEAKKLLSERIHSIMDISTILGFANSSHFSKVFKQVEGCTPKQYQNRHKDSK